MVQGLALVVMIHGLVLMLLGRAYLRALRLPLAYLFLMVPVLDVVIERVHWPFQLFSATMSSKLLSLINIPVFQNAQFLELPNITLEVAEECSGVNFLVSIFALAIPLAYFTQRKWWPRALLIMLAIFIGVLTNVLRITLIGVWAFAGGKVVHGPLHIFQGLFVSIVGFMFLFFTVWLFSKLPFSKARETGKKEGFLKDTYLDQKKFNRAWIAAMAVLLFLGGYLYLHSLKPIPLKADLKTLPLRIGAWEGVDIDYNKESLRVYGADNEVMRSYSNASGRRFKLYAGYFDSQSQKKKLIQYGLGKLYIDSGEIEIHAGSNLVRVNKAVYRDGSWTRLVFFWFDLNGQIVTSKYKVKFLTALDGIIYRRTNGAIVIVSGEINNPSETDKSAFNDELSFVQAVLPVLRNHLPSDKN